MREDEEVDGEGDEGEASEERGTCPVRPVFAGARDGECAEVGDGCGRGRVEHDMGHVGETRGECAAVGHRELAREEELYCVAEGWACEGRRDQRYRDRIAVRDQDWNLGGWTWGRQMKVSLDRSTGEQRSGRGVPCRIWRDGIQQTKGVSGSREARAVRRPRHLSPFSGNMMGRAPRFLGARRPACSLILNDPCLIQTNLFL